MGNEPTRDWSDEYTGWTPGCYGFRRPVVAIASNLVIWRHTPGSRTDVEIVVATRGSNQRFEANMTMLAFGGFLDPDETPLAAVERDGLQEELRGLTLEVDPRPIFGAPSSGLRYRWDATNQVAVPTDFVAQRPPVSTIEYIAEWKGGELQGDADEVMAPRWERVSKLAAVSGEFAFNMALILQWMVREFPIYLETLRYRQALLGRR